MNHDDFFAIRRLLRLTKNRTALLLDLHPFVIVDCDNAFHPHRKLWRKSLWPTNAAIRRWFRQLAAKLRPWAEAGAVPDDVLVNRDIGPVTVIARIAQGATRSKPLWRCLCRCGCSTTCILSEDELLRLRWSEPSLTCLAEAQGHSGPGQYGRGDLEKSGRREQRERNADTSWTPDMQAALCAFQTRCVVCRWTEGLTTDHVLPLAAGYGLAPGNAVRLCLSCNSCKSTKGLDQLPEATKRKIKRAAAAFGRHWQGLQRADAEGGWGKDGERTARQQTSNADEV